MLRLAFKATIWATRLYYPMLRLGGRLTGREEQVENLIQVSEENIERTARALGIPVEEES